MNRATDAGDAADAADGELEIVDDRTPAERMMAQLGGVAGIIYSSVPVLVFVGTSRLLGLPAASCAALGVATLILLWRLVRRESVQPAVSGLIGVGVCVLIAYLLGQSKGYFLLGIWTSLLYAAVFAVSIVIRRPVVGYIWSWLHGHDRGWRNVRRAVYAFDVATLTWVVVFGARFVVQRVLYDTNHEGWLVVARIAMGWPLAALAALVTFLAIRVAQRALDGLAGDGLAGDGSDGVEPSRQQMLAQFLFRLGDRDEQQLVAAFQRLVVLRHDHPGPAQNRDQRDVSRQLQLAYWLAAPGCVVRQGDLDEVGLTLPEFDQPDQVADRNGFFD